MIRISSMVLVTASLALAACSSTKSAEPEQASSKSASHPSAPPAQGMGGICPMQVPGTTVAATDIEGGVALDFTTSGGDVAELRQRVAHMAAMRAQHGGGMMGGGMGHMGQGGMGQGGMSQGGMGGGMMMPAATTSVEDVAAGSRMILRATDPAQVEALRTQTRAWAEQMGQAHECPMMSGGAAPAAPAPSESEHQGHHDETPAR